MEANMSNPDTPRTKRLVPLSLPGDARWGFTRDGLYEVRHHFHWIPVTKGMARSFIAKHWPGLVWNDMVILFDAHDIWIPDESHFSRKDLAPHVKEFHILHDGTGRVVPFADGEAVDLPPAPKGGGFNVQVTPSMLDTREGRRALAKQILEGLRPD